MGIQLEGCTGDIVFENFNVTQRVPGHALCLCREPNSGSFGEKTAVIEIADVEQLALYLTLNNAELGRRPLVREVSYGEVDVEANPYNAGSASPFLKGVSFQRENELRIFWPSQRAQPFISKPMVLPDGLVSWVNA